jgi:hypothetical protein
MWPAQFRPSSLAIIFYIPDGVGLSEAKLKKTVAVTHPLVPYHPG